MLTLVTHYFLTEKIGRAPRILTYGNVVTMENPHFFKIGDKAYFGYQGVSLKNITLTWNFDVSKCSKYVKTTPLKYR